jgi:hypothetical protein
MPPSSVSAHVGLHFQTALTAVGVAVDLIPVVLIGGLALDLEVFLVNVTAMAGGAMIGIIALIVEICTEIVGGSQVEISPRMRAMCEMRRSQMLHVIP